MFPTIYGIIRNWSGLTFLLRDEFTTPDDAPITSPRTAEPGPGTLAVTDTGNNLSVSGGNLSVTTAVAWGDPGVWDITGIAASVGLAALARVKIVTSDATTKMMVSFDVNKSGLPSGGGALYFETGGQVKLYPDNIAGIDTWSIDTWYEVAVVLGADNVKIFFGDKLVFVGSVSISATLYSSLIFLGSGHQRLIDYFRVAQLAAPFNTDNGLATDTELGTPAAGTTFTHEADCIVEFIATTLPAPGNLDCFFRVQDANNYWIARVTAAGTLDLIEVVAGGETSRGSGGTVTNGERIVIVADDDDISGYADNAQDWLYSSAANFKTETDGELDSLGTGGVVSNIITWPRTLSGAALAELEAYTA